MTTAVRHLNRVTFTGADESVDGNDLAAISDEFPFVEWGILFSPKRQRSPRFPAMDWVGDLLSLAEYRTRKGIPMRLSAHLCGGYVRELLDGRFTWRSYLGPVAFGLFERVQLNFHREAQLVGAGDALEAAGVPFIFQCDGVNDRQIRVWVGRGLGVPLFDTSGGAGVLPDVWPHSWPGHYCGYAGGLGPENVLDQLNGPIGDVAHGPIWVDMETRVRDYETDVFDLGKVRAVCESLGGLIDLAKLRLWETSL